jgi:DNA-binding transcriptional LysR family regulator
MNLKHMQHALTLSQEMNFARAAEKVHLSQPAFSRSIQALEKQLGMVLFDRNKQGLAITAVGAQFLLRAKRLLHEARSLEADMALTRSGELGQVTFGCGPLPAASIAPQLLQCVREARPQLRIALLVNNFKHLLSYLHNEEIEFFIAETRDIPVDTGISISPLIREYGCLVCRPGHPLLAFEQVHLKDLLAYGFATLKMPKGITAQLVQAFGLAPNSELPLALECDNIRVLSEVVRHGELIMLASHAAVEPELQAGLLRTLVVVDAPVLFAEVGIVQLSQRSLSPAAQIIITALQEIAQARNSVAAP